MEADSIRHDDMESDPSQKLSDSLLDFSNVLQSTRIRRLICSCNEVDGVFLGYGYYFLLPIGIILWLILLIA
jgi:hypothetical protein